MLSNDVAKSAALKASLSEVNINLTRALEAQEDVPDDAFGREEDRFRLVELIAQVGGIVAGELAKRSRDESR